MKSFLQIKKSTEEQLGRELREKELAFLQWVYEGYTEEQQQMNTS
ncbi:hypothetical protein [Lentibacillus sp.]|nr:hypothetical protein [Lentibacillus sp.]HLS08630.1 hypothetical protein [Lentibacillus sp.]